MTRYSTLHLEQTDEHQWTATQRGVDLTGRGNTAAEATANYCELVAMTGERVVTDGGNDEH
jgi:hypothetical protein